MAPSLQGIRILVVEDHADTRELLEQSLAMMGAKVAAAASARDAVTIAPGADIIVTDLALSGEDGVWLCEQVRQGPRPIPVIACSGFSADQAPAMKHAGFARILLKPVVPDELAAVVVDVLRGQRPTRAA